MHRDRSICCSEVENLQLFEPIYSRSKVNGVARTDRFAETAGFLDWHKPWFIRVTRRNVQCRAGGHRVLNVKGVDRSGHGETAQITRAGQRDEPAKGHLARTECQRQHGARRVDHEAWHRFRDAGVDGIPCRERRDIRKGAGGRDIRGEREVDPDNVVTPLKQSVVRVPTRVKPVGKEYSNTGSGMAVAVLMLTETVSALRYPSGPRVCAARQRMAATGVAACSEPNAPQTCCKAFALVPIISRTLSVAVTRCRHSPTSDPTNRASSGRALATSVRGTVGSLATGTLGGLSSAGATLLETDRRDDFQAIPVAATRQVGAGAFCPTAWPPRPR